MNGVTNPNQQLQPSQTNLLNKYRNGQIPPQQMNNQPVQQNQTIQTTNTVNNNEPVRTYIPSPIGVQLNAQEDVTAAEQAMQRADFAEQEALKTLKMN